MMYVESAITLSTQAGPVGPRGMPGYCPNCKASSDSITWDAKTDVCICKCGWTNALVLNKKT